MPAPFHCEIEQGRDVPYLIRNDLRFMKESTEFFMALGMKVVSFETGS